ncbi:phosphoribosylanthranilate isomerase [Polaribacter sp. WD7]|nr:phosphoribosylanthranilate isomerase [uncultured Polaribacter sp.]RCS26740.1 phosphoribosylanthranilate isomerase [Polaribacter sp. WD7]
MKYIENMQQVAALEPDYLGFIFYEKSKRNFEGIIPDLPEGIKKVGVFVNEIPEILVSIVEEYQLDAIQLHGDESVEYINSIRAKLEFSRTSFIEQNKGRKKVKKPKSYQNLEIIKVFGIKDEFNFEILKPYVNVVDYFLFDTKGKERGGNGVKFDWSVLEKYPLDIPFFLSGGIGLDDVEQIQIVTKANLPIYALDVNSKFETEPGKKKIQELKQFKEVIISSEKK